MGNNYYKYNGNGFDVLDEPIHGPGFKPDKCGQPSNYRMHKRYGVPLCDACREANRACDRARCAKRRARKEQRN
jgi:hypothetical protein